MSYLYIEILKAELDIRIMHKVYTDSKLFH